MPPGEGGILGSQRILKRAMFRPLAGRSLFFARSMPRTTTR
jgi:hypothetical protein